MKSFDPKTVTATELRAIIDAELDQQFVNEFANDFDVQLDPKDWDTSFYNYARSRLSDWIEDGPYWRDSHSWTDIKAYLEDDVDNQENVQTVERLNQMLNYISRWLHVRTVVLD